jgi:Family of unknown function (DUF5330)
MDKNIPVERTALSTLPARLRERAATYAAGDAGVMFFLLRMTFWLGVVLVLLPSGSAQRATQSGDVSTPEAISAASATVSDLRGFCTRQPDACTVGSQVAVSLGYRAQAGAKMLYDFLTEAMAPKDTGALAHGTGPRGSTAKVEPVKSAPPSQNTLTPADLAPAWRAPQPPKDAKHAA